MAKPCPEIAAVRTIEPNPGAHYTKEIERNVLRHDTAVSRPFSCPIRRTVKYFVLVILYDKRQPAKSYWAIPELLTVDIGQLAPKE